MVGLANSSLSQQTLHRRSDRRNLATCESNSWDHWVLHLLKRFRTRSPSAKKACRNLINFADTHTGAAVYEGLDGPASTWLKTQAELHPGVLISYAHECAASDCAWPGSFDRTSFKERPSSRSTSGWPSKARTPRFHPFPTKLLCRSLLGSLGLGSNAPWPAGNLQILAHWCTHRARKMASLCALSIA